MTTFVALPLSPEYLKISDQVFEKLNTDNKSSQARDTVKGTKLLLDDMFKIMVDELVERVEMKSFSRKVIHQVGALSHKTVNVLIDKVISKLDNKELLPLVKHFKACEIEHKGEKFLGFQLNHMQEAQLFRCIEGLKNGEVEAVKQDLVALLESVLAVGIELFLHTPMSLIHLGLIARKVVDFVGGTIEKIAPPAIGKIVGHMEHDELKSFEIFLLELVIIEE